MIRSGLARPPRIDSMQLLKNLAIILGAGAFLAASLYGNAAPGAQAAQAARGNVPTAFKRPEIAGDYIEREVMIPMRDGVKLKTFIVMLKGTANAPIIFTRTPYNAAARVRRNDS